jgi:elongation factor P
LAIDTSDFKNGMGIYLNNEVYTIVEFQHVKPGKGGAFVRTRLKKVRDGATLEKTFRAGEKVEPAYLEKRPLQFLYKQGDEVTLMDMDSYEQEQIDAKLLGEGMKYLKEEMDVQALMAGDTVLGYEIPNFVELEVVETDPGFKGDTVSGTKPAKLETGATIQVPFHINQGDILKVDTRTDSYIERVKK